MKEAWKDVVGYEGKYQVSNFGNVRSVDRITKSKNNRDYFWQGKLLNQFDNGHGYKTVSLCKNGKAKTLYIHRLVAVAFLENPNNFTEINHKDENPANNDVSNLEWCNAKYNKNYGNRAKKFSISRGKPVKCVETGVVYHGVREASRQIGISASSISACCKGYRNTETAGGFHWTDVIS